MINKPLEKSLKRYGILYNYSVKLINLYPNFTYILYHTQLTLHRKVDIHENILRFYGITNVETGGTSGKLYLFVSTLCYIFYKKLCSTHPAQNACELRLVV